MHILLIWKTDLVVGLYVYILDIRKSLPLVIPNNEMTFPSFQKYSFQLQQEAISEQCCNSLLFKKNPPHKTGIMIVLCHLCSVPTQKYSDYSPLSGDWCYAEGSRAITVYGNPPSQCRFSDIVQ